MCIYICIYIYIIYFIYIIYITYILYIIYIHNLYNKKNYIYIYMTNKKQLTLHVFAFY